MAKDFYKIQKGLSVVPRPAPSSPDNGDIWYDQALNKFQKRENGLTSDLSSGGGSSPELTERLDRLEKNYLINGAFDFWQRGTTRSAPIFGGYAYTADRWALSGGNGFISAALVRQTFVLGQTDVPGNPTYYGRIFGLGSPGTDAYLEQRVEGVRLLAGKTMTFSCWVKRDTGSGGVGGVFIKVRNNYGTGGSPSAEEEFFSTGENFTTLDQWVKVTATFTVPSIAGKTIGTAGNDYLAVAVVCKQTGWNIAQCMLNHGDTAPDFVRAGKNLAEELAMCQRYYEKSYSVDVAPGTNDLVGMKGAVATATGRLGPGVQFVTTKRAVPTITLYSQNGTNSKVTALGGANAGGGVVGTSGENGPSGSISITSDGTGFTAGSFYYYHFAADSELL